MRIQATLEALATEVLHDVHGVDHPALVRAAQGEHGDFQINAAMPLAKKLKRAPRDLAAPLAEAMANNPAVASAEVAGPGFVNLRLASSWLADRIQGELSDGAQDGVPKVDAPQRIVVDFSSPNIAKQMHVGHLRSTIIGDALVRMLRFVGHDVIADNHLGDWGTQFGLLIIGMRDEGDEGALKERPIVELERVYKIASQRAKEDDAYAEQARAELAKLQRGEPENRALWERFVAATRVALDEVYDRLGVSFDEWLGESAYEDMLPGVAERLLDAGIAREDQGALCVFFNELAGAPADLKKREEPFIVRKKDGAFLYSTTDIATLFYRADRFKAERSVYVVDKRQALHFKQLFAVAGLLGLDLELEHVGFGTVMGPDGKPIRTRDAEGNTVTLLSLLEEAERRAEKRIRSSEKIRVPEELIPQVARSVGIGAVKYADLCQNRMSDYRFDLDKMVEFQGNAGPYLQYQCARCLSILRNGGVSVDEAQGPVELNDAGERALALRLLKFGDQVHDATETLQPHLIADHLYELAQQFSRFYTECPVLKAEGPTRSSRLALTALTARQLSRGLTLLGIEVVPQM